MEFLQNISLAPYTTFKIGGPAQWFAEAASEEDVLEAVDFARKHALPLFVLGGGSNLLVADGGFAGVVLRIALRGTTEWVDGDRLICRVAAGEDWDGFVSRVVSRECAGVECLAGIPGQVGGTPVQNVGAYGQEVSETIRTVRVLCAESREFIELDNAACCFAYRESLFNTAARGKYIVTRVDYVLRAGGAPMLGYADLRRHFQAWQTKPSLAEVAQVVRGIRRDKGMFLVPGDPDCASAGSFFKNPVVDQEVFSRVESAVPGGTAIPQYPAPEGKVKLPAAWLLEKAGFSKGFGVGRAGISTRHTLALVNRGGAAAEDVLRLSEQIVAGVEARFGIRLEREPVYLG